MRARASLFVLLKVTSVPNSFSGWTNKQKRLTQSYFISHMTLSPLLSEPISSCRGAKLIAGLPLRLISFRIISSEKKCFANKMSSKKRFFGGYKKTIFRPFWSMFCPIWSTFNLIQCEITIFSPCWWNFLSHFLLPSPYPQIPDARMSQFVLSCPAVTGLKLQTMVLDEKCKPSIHGYPKEAFPDKKTFLDALASLGSMLESQSVSH